jgi:hypothetical protein
MATFGRDQKSEKLYIQNLSQNSNLEEGPKIPKTLIHNLSPNSSLREGPKIPKALYPQPFPK